MKDLEAKLKELQFRQPSVCLDQRVLAQKPRTQKTFFACCNSISLGWSTAVALLMGISGFFIGLHWQDRHITIDWRQFPIHEVRSVNQWPMELNPFVKIRDTNNIPKIPFEQWETKIKISGGSNDKNKL